MSDRARRVALEVRLLRQVFPAVDWDDEEGSWVAIWGFPLPPSLGRRATNLLIRPPADYPRTPPDGIFVDQGLRLPEHYFQRQGDYNDLAGHGWAWYCFHLQGHAGGWAARSRIMEGDNLLRFIHLVRVLMERAADRA